ncbi:5852_t:CDS:2, partial [Gigaspora margarita]
MESDTKMNAFQYYPIYPLFEDNLFSRIVSNGFEDNLFVEFPKMILCPDNLNIKTGFKTNNITSNNLDDSNTETQQYNSGVNTSVNDSIIETQLPESENNSVVDIQEDEESDKESFSYVADNNIKEHASQPLLFNHLKTIRTSYNEQKQNSKQKYGYGISHAKKALDYAIYADTVNELVDYLEEFIEKTKIELDKQQNHIENVENMDIDITDEAIILNNDNNLESNGNSSNSNSSSKR